MSDTTKTHWQVWALMKNGQSDWAGPLEVWVPVTMEYREERTAQRVASQLWLTCQVREVKAHDDVDG